MAKGKPAKSANSVKGYHLTLEYQESEDLYFVAIVRHGEVIWGPKPGGNPATLVLRAWEYLIEKADEDLQNQRRSEKAMKAVNATLEAHGI